MPRLLLQLLLLCGCCGGGGGGSLCGLGAEGGTSTRGGAVCGKGTGHTAGAGQRMAMLNTLSVHNCIFCTSISARFSCVHLLH